MSIMSAFILGLSILLSTGVLAYTFRKIDDNHGMYCVAMDTLVDLVNKLNRELPGCHLKIEKSNKSISITGDIKYLKKQ